MHQKCIFFISDTDTGAKKTGAERAGWEGGEEENKGGKGGREEGKKGGREEGKMSA